MILFNGNKKINLVMEILKSDHTDIEHPQLDCDQPTIMEFASVKASQVYGWMDFMPMKDVPFLWSKPGETNQ
jgi:hypothetical protein